jgi:hypothetical protein
LRIICADPPSLAHRSDGEVSKDSRPSRATEVWLGCDPGDGKIVFLLQVEKCFVTALLPEIILFIVLSSFSRTTASARLVHPRSSNRSEIS